MAATKTERLDKIYQQLSAAPCAATHEEAFQQLCDIVNQVEDLLTSTRYDPSRWRNDGRLYPPQEDSAYEVEHFPDVKRYRSRRHNTYIGRNGAIEIATTDGKIEFSKSGRNGSGVWSK